MWRVQLFELNYDEREEAAVAEVLKSRWITMGPRTKEFEKEFSARVVDNLPSTAVSSGTAALHMALLALDIKPGDQVALPALTFIADLNVVSMVGAVPVLVDCESFENWNISPEGLAKALGPKTKAVILVHYAGYPCKLDEILPLCREKSVAVIEDCAHAPGASYKGRKLGTWGDIGCFSFFTNKNLSIGEGGMFVTASSTLDQAAKRLRSHGMTTLTLDRYKGRAISYDVVRAGLNYRLDEIRAALGLAQLKKLEEANKKRGELTHYYVKKLQSIEKLTIPFRDMMSGNNAFHIFPVLLDDSVDRTRLIMKLREAGVETSIHYPAFSSFSAYGDFDPASTPIANAISERVLTLPLHPKMTYDDVDYVVGHLSEALSD